MLYCAPVAKSLSADVRRALARLEKHGFLLLQDPRLPNLAALVAGKPVRGSWWGHRAGSRIFDVAGRLEQHKDVLIIKLVAGKVTFVHRRFWPALAAIGRAREGWQTRGLSRPARRLLARVDDRQCVHTTGGAARELERALLVVGRDVHTDSGAHAKELTTWERFAREVGVPLRRRSAARAREELEAAAEEMAEESGARVSLPWQ